MRVRKSDGSCPACGGVLDIVDVEDCFLRVLCVGCGEEYHVEPKAFGPPLRYVVPFMDWVDAGKPAGQEPKPIT